MRPPFGEHPGLYGCLGFLAHGLNGLFSSFVCNTSPTGVLNTNPSSSTPCSSIEDGTRPKRAALNRASDFITKVNRMHKLKPRGDAAKGGQTAGRGRKRQSERPLSSESAASKSRQR